ncbi:Lrp/AsnC family transcriptional regulator [Arthrobacter alpinus]|uniref:Lrp/AsnC family transcriptional regulator n=1 Tax=Arthrobacter alpinus TaxID=656366 RepID=UPI001E3B2DE3|nr:winged helix-turn-helix transcriptional regulator [Arthrobacter alpinus]
MVILRELSQDARTPNNLLARRTGLAPSTCLNRVRALREAGIIRGFHADIDLGSLGFVHLRVDFHRRPWVGPPEHARAGPGVAGSAANAQCVCPGRRA